MTIVLVNFQVVVLIMCGENTIRVQTVLLDQFGFVSWTNEVATLTGAI